MERSPRLSIRLRALALVAGLAVPAIAVGCGARVVVDGTGGTVGTSGTGSEGGGANGGGNTGGSGVDAGCTLTTTTGGNGLYHQPECFSMPPNGCPNQYDANQHIMLSPPCKYLKGVDCGPVVEGALCCYMITCTTN
jgi:hypothetical protein